MNIEQFATIDQWDSMLGKMLIAHEAKFQLSQIAIKHQRNVGETEVK